MARWGHNRAGVCPAEHYVMPWGRYAGHTAQQIADGDPEYAVALLHSRHPVVAEVFSELLAEDYPPNNSQPEEAW